MRRKTEWTLVVSYLGFVSALGATAVWAQQRVSALNLSPRLQSASAGASGDRAPSFKLENLDGDEVSLADLRGEQADRVVVLEWFDPACDWETTYHSATTTMRDLYNEFHASGVQWVAIYSSMPAAGSDPVEINRKAVREWSISYPVLLDGDGSTAKLYKVERAPSVVVVSSKGEIIYTGAIDDATMPGKAGTQNYLRQALESALRGETPSSASVPGPGCKLGAKEAGDRL